MIYLGIDPGQDGGVSMIDNEKNIWYINKYDDISFSKLICDLHKNTIMNVYIEDVHAIRGAKANATFKFGFNTGKAHGIIAASGRTPNLVLPQVWKEEFNLNLGHEYDKDSKKKASIEKAKELFPNVNLVPYKCKVEHDGMAESLLIAEWGRRKFLKK